MYEKTNIFNVHGNKDGTLYIYSKEGKGADVDISDLNNLSSHVKNVVVYSCYANLKIVSKRDNLTNEGRWYEYFEKNRVIITDNRDNSGIAYEPGNYLNSFNLAYSGNSNIKTKRRKEMLSNWR